MGELDQKFGAGLLFGGRNRRRFGRRPGIGDSLEVGGLGRHLGVSPIDVLERNVVVKQIVQLLAFGLFDLLFLFVKDGLEGIVTKLADATLECSLGGEALEAP